MPLKAPQGALVQGPGGRLAYRAAQPVAAPSAPPAHAAHAATRQEPELQPLMSHSSAA